MAVSKAGKNHIYLHRQQHIKVVNFFQRIQENRQYHRTRVRINREKKQSFNLVHRLVTRCLKQVPKTLVCSYLNSSFQCGRPDIQIQLVFLFCRSQFNYAHQITNCFQITNELHNILSGPLHKMKRQRKYQYLTHVKCIQRKTPSLEFSVNVF